MDVKTILLYEVSVKYTPSQIRNTWLLTDKASADKIGELLENYYTYQIYGKPIVRMTYNDNTRGPFVYVNPVVCAISEPNDVLIWHNKTNTYSGTMKRINDLMTEIKDKDTEALLEILGEIPPSKLKIKKQWFFSYLHNPTHYKYSFEFTLS